MAQIPDYEREIRGSDGEVYVESFTSIVDDINGYQQNTYKLESTMPGTMAHFLGGYKWKHITSTGAIEEVEDRMGKFPWWSKPSNPEAITKKYAEGGRKPLSAKPDVVTFVTHFEKVLPGCLVLQHRSFISPKGTPVGNPGMESINGGGMKTSNMDDELQREGFEELGVDIAGAYENVGKVYDPDEGRTNHVVRLTKGYDVLLDEQGTSKLDVIARLFGKLEGLGRDIAWREDIEYMMANKLITPISVLILEAFPDLLPPPRPKA